MCFHVLLQPHLMPWVCLDLWELKLGVVGIHLSDLLLGGGAEDLDDLYQLVHTTVSWEDWLTQQQLCKHTTCTPDVWEKVKIKIFKHKAVYNGSFLSEAQGMDKDRQYSEVVRTCTCTYQCHKYSRWLQK